jgi:hypothetical protein
MQKEGFLVSAISERIYFIRGHRIMLDRDLAELYSVETRSINQAVRRNIERFPEDFMFQVTDTEYERLRSQFVILESHGRGKYSKYLPYAFTEQGIAMLSSVLKSKTAIQVNVSIMRTFVKLRGILETNKELAKRLNDLEQKFSRHDDQFKAVFTAIREMIATPRTQKRIKGLSK